MTTPFVGTDELRWRNTTRGVRLFVRAAFAGLDPARPPEGPDDHLMSALFVFGAIDLAGDLVRLPGWARRRMELVFLRRAYGVGRLHSRRLRRELHAHGQTARGQITLREGRTALVEWFQGADPSLRLRAQIDRMPGARLPVKRRAPRRTQHAARRPALARAAFDR